MLCLKNFSVTSQTVLQNAEIEVNIHVPALFNILV